jgi:hypothetical protein
LNGLLRTGGAACAALAALSLAACGGGEASGSSDSDRTSFRDAQLAFAKCMRENGVNVPDPKPGERGRFRLELKAESDADREKTKQAMDKCQKHLDAVKPPELSEEQQAELRDWALKQARCMRRKGIDVPDPQFEGKGGVTQRIPKSLDVTDQEVRAAEEACRREVGEPKGLPKPGETGSEE